MKKAISLLLAFVLCLSLCACGDKNNSSNAQSNGENVITTEIQNETTAVNKADVTFLCQEWRCVANGNTASFDEENFYINGNAYPYVYDDETNTITVNVGVDAYLPVTNTDGVYCIDVEGEDYVPASEYERLHDEYVETQLISTDLNGEPCLNVNLVGEILERIELTTENWRDYIRVYSYDFEMVAKDAFGEVVNSEVITENCLGYGVERYHAFDAVIELKHKQTGELTTYTMRNNPCTYEIDSNMNLDDYECTRIEGYFYFVDIPEELIVKVDREGTYVSNSYFKIGDSSFNTTWYLDCEAKFVKVRSSTLDDYLD